MTVSTDKCPICTINCYGKEILAVDVKTEKGKSIKTISGKPKIFPCGVYRPNQGRCPWETEKEQAELSITHDYEKIAGVLGSQHNDGII